MMGFGEQAFAIASTTILLVVLALMGVRVMRGFREPQLLARAEARGLSAMICIAFLGLGIERGYYLAARILARQGLDLWSLHPAPEVLSAVVATGLYLFGLPLLRATELERGRAVARVAAEALGLTLLWVAIAVVLT